MHKNESDIREKTRRIKASFWQAIQAFEGEDTHSASEIGRELVKDLSSVVDDITKDYHRAFLANKIPHFEKDREFIAHFKEAEQKDVDLARMREFLIGLEQSIAMVEKEISSNYPRKPAIVKFARRHAKKILVAVVTVLAFSFCMYFFRTVRMKKRGLIAQYYSDTNLKKPYKSKQEQNINFEWGYGPAMSGWRKDDFSVEWTGFLHITKSGTYELYTHSDDGVRLWIDNVPVIENWKVHKLEVNLATLKLDEGYHPIKLEYFEAKRNSVIKLYWKADYMPKAVPIPASNFVPLAAYLKQGVPVYGAISNN